LIRHWFAKPDFPYGIAAGNMRKKITMAALACGGEVHVLIVGHRCVAAIEAASNIAGVTKMLVADAPNLADGVAKNVSEQRC
jgi:hypothetical protein